MSSVVSPCLFRNKKMTFSMKLDENYDCVCTKITSSEFMENMCYFHFQMQVCTHVVICGSDESYFEQLF